MCTTRQQQRCRRSSKSKKENKFTPVREKAPSDKTRKSRLYVPSRRCAQPVNPSPESSTSIHASISTRVLSLLLPGSSPHLGSFSATTLEGDLAMSGTRATPSKCCKLFFVVVVVVTSNCSSDTYRSHPLGLSRLIPRKPQRNCRRDKMT